MDSLSFLRLNNPRYDSYQTKDDYQKDGSFNLCFITETQSTPFRAIVSTPNPYVQGVRNVTIKSDS